MYIIDKNIFEVETDLDSFFATSVWTSAAPSAFSSNWPNLPATPLQLVAGGGGGEGLDSWRYSVKELGISSQKHTFSDQTNTRISYKHIDTTIIIKSKKYIYLIIL